MHYIDDDDGSWKAVPSGRSIRRRRRPRSGRPIPDRFLLSLGRFFLRCGAFAKEKGAPRTFSGNIKRKWRASHFFRIPFCSDGNLKEKRTRRTFWTDSFLIRTVPWRRVVPDRSVGTAGSKIVRCNVPGPKRWERRRP
jgi:hypothetical protein